MTTMKILIADKLSDVGIDWLNEQEDVETTVQTGLSPTELAEIAGEYLKKGSKVYVEGRLQTRKWQGQDGQDRYTTEIVADQMQMLDSRGGGEENFSGNTAAFSPPPGPPQPEQPAAQPQQPASSAPPDDFDDDIPF